MSDVMVRLGTDVDVEAVVELWRELMAVHQAIAPMVWTLSEDAEERYRAHLADMMQDPNRRVFVAARQDEVVGYLVAEKGDRPPVLTPSTRGVFGEICVAPAARRGGCRQAAGGRGDEMVSRGGPADGRGGLCHGQPDVGAVLGGTGVSAVPGEGGALSGVQRVT